MPSRAFTAILGGDWNRPLWDATRRLVSAVGVSIDWQEPQVAAMGAKGWDDNTWDTVVQSVRSTGVALCGAMPMASDFAYRSPHVVLRERCGCFAGLRPIRSLRGLPARLENLDLLVVRETTEDVYAGHEHEVMPGGVATLKVVTETAVERIARFAFAYARNHGKKRVSVIHKANIMKLTDGLFLRTTERVAQEFPGIETETLIVDNACMQMVLRPERYEVILCGNLYGDILSSLAAGLTGGSAAMAGVGIGEGVALFESLTTPATEAAKTSAASPLPLLLPAFYLLHHLGETAGADRLWQAIEQVLLARQSLTPDLGGSASTEEMTDALLRALEAPAPHSA